MYWLLIAIRRFWTGDSRPEARWITFGCAVIVIFIFVMFAIAKMAYRIP